MLEVGVKNYANVSGTLTATPVEGEPEVIELDPGDTYIFAQEIKKGKKLNTVYSSVAVVYDENHRWDMNTNRTINSRLIDDANILYIVTFDSNGGSAVPEQGVSYGDKVVRPTAPTKGGYTFGGWFADDSLTTPFDFDTIITSDITLYAKWDEEQIWYTITIRNGDSIDSCTVTATQGGPIGTVETYTLAPGESQVLAISIPAGQRISNRYSSIVTSFGSVDFTVDTSTVMDENKTFTYSIPHPTPDTLTIRLENISPASTFIYFATPADTSLPQETGMVASGNYADLNLQIAEGSAISTQYSSISVAFQGETPEYVNVSDVPVGVSNYAIYQFTDQTPPVTQNAPVVIRNASQASASCTYYALYTDGVTRDTGTLGAGQSVTLTNQLAVPIDGTTGVTLSTIYNMITVAFDGDFEQWIDVNHTYYYGDLTNGELIIEVVPHTEMEFIPIIQNSSESEPASLRFTYGGETETVTIQPQSTYTLSHPVHYGQTINNVYDYCAYKYASMSDYYTGIGDINISDGSPLVINDMIEIRVMNNSYSSDCTVMATRVSDGITENYPLLAGNTATLRTKIPIETYLNATYSSISVAYSAGTLNLDVNREILYNYNGYFTFTVSDEVRIELHNTETSQNASFYYQTTDSQSGSGTVIAQNYEIVNWNYPVALGQAINTVFTEIRYTYDNTNFKYIDVTATVSPAQVSDGAYKIDINAQP